ncbi:hypothetical protein TWF788_002602 [Orbilia oligospora]|uniref:Uncharacterized protein n=1 Tax=Orbilia oligospora TaxID=2813651 RepID=A0A6G1LU81_ORBOL|nr:hypothetical protein TWF788_002602 [Orbilia oligospora]KAF3215121.1 hypothetical protein TWF191_009414 [Orbilia oligospora]KAF3222534.1 hypothetical protein TWF679_006005 [Orbilia oligospora]KAF3234329.1 hypothetical protein TWF192_001563 [Orbilia oligospora]
MGMEDTWYDYYRGPSSAPSFSEKFIPQAPNLTITTASPAPLSPAPSAAFDQHAGLDYAPALVNNVWREDERRAAIKAKHGRERQLIGLILEVLCQIAGFTCAIVFGIWAVKSYNVSVVALKVQTVANQLALRSLCADDACWYEFHWKYQYGGRVFDTVFREPPHTEHHTIDEEPVDTAVARFADLLIN